MLDPWLHIQQIARSLTEDYEDAVFIGGVGVSTHVDKLGTRFSETSHDGDFCLSIQGKSELRDRYEVYHNKRINKDSVIIEGEEFDLYVEHQNSLAVPYAEIFAYAEDYQGVRVAALEHLLVLKLDAAKDRWGSSKGEKDVRDLARIVALIDNPREELLAPYMNTERKETLEQVLGKRNLPKMLGLNAHEGSRFSALLDTNLKAIEKACIPKLIFESVDMYTDEPSTKPPKKVNEEVTDTPSPKPSFKRRP